MQGFWRALSTDQLQLSFKERLLTALTCFSALLLTAWLSTRLAPGQSPMLVASMGASAVILFVIPSSPLAQPWPFVMGQLLSACVGVTAVYLSHSLPFAAALAVGLSVLVMLLLRCVHPPGAATALAPLLNQSFGQPVDFTFVLLPVGLNVALMLACAIILQRFILKRHYPTPKLSLQPAQRSASQADTKQGLAAFYAPDLLAAIADYQDFVDVSYSDLSKLFAEVQLKAYQRHYTDLTCADIMLRDVTTLAYDTEVEAAWLLLRQQSLKAMPVLDRARHVIGIVTPYDFYKHVNLTPSASFYHSFLAFIRKTPELTTHKPEAIGHIMTRNVATLPQSAQIAELVQLMSEKGHQYIPIIDEQRHFVGMVRQSDFIIALFHNKLQVMAER